MSAISDCGGRSALQHSQLGRSESIGCLSADSED
jgi:hypothetical protein